jgi:N-carbamoylputrescine amidase
MALTLANTVSISLLRSSLLSDFFTDTFFNKYLGKTHIPDGTGYQEKFYFSPGDTGFKVFDTRIGKVGVGICWDQWFPEAARSMALLGADILLYPTAIGSEPQDPTLNSADHWQRVMQGHAAANVSTIIYLLESF